MLVVIQVVLSFVVPLFLGLIFFVWWVVQFLQLAVLILSILGIMNVIQGKEKELPIVGKFAHIFPI